MLLSRLQAAREKLFEGIHYIEKKIDRLLSTSHSPKHDEIKPDVKNLHTSVQQLHALLNQMMSDVALEQLVQQVDIEYICSKIRHDLRNPISPLQGYAELILDDLEHEQDTEVIEYLQDIIERSKIMLQLIEQFHPHDEPLSTSPVKITHAFKPIKNNDYLKGFQNDEFLSFKASICILVVDDIEVNRTILGRHLAHLGYQNIVYACDGEEALALMKELSVDMLLLDIDMPKKDGVAVLQAIQDSITKGKIDVLMISASDTMENILYCLELGAVDFLPKPFQRELLNVRIASCVQKRWLAWQAEMQQQQVQDERYRFEQLLKAIFPPVIVNELTCKGEIDSSYYNGIAVIFTDIVGFTKYCDSHSLPEVMRGIQFFSDVCEELSIKHNLQKIKTIGDCFLATAGMLTHSENPVLDCVLFAKDLMDTCLTGEPRWELRSGINYGSIIGGIIGHRQYLYDIWGDTVNTASRIQSSTAPKTIALSKQAWAKIDDLAVGESQGKIWLKGKGEVEIIQFMHFR